MIKTVLFDLDGTLLNTIDDLADAGNWVCEQHGWPTFTVEQFKHMVGNGIPKLVERFSPENARTPEQLAATLAEFTARYDAHKEDKTAPYPGIPELLDELQAAGVQCAVFSNKADPLCGKIIAHYFGTGRFAAVRGSRPGGCMLDTAQCKVLQAKLLSIMDPERDSLRFYYLGKRYENKIEHFGSQRSYQPEAPLIL